MNFAIQLELNIFVLAQDIQSARMISLVYGPKVTLQILKYPLRINIPALPILSAT
jgi:hypothetical protein